MIVLNPPVELLSMQRERLAYELFCIQAARLGISSRDSVYIIKKADKSAFLHLITRSVYQIAA